MGNTVSQSSIDQVAKDHPHIHGEYQIMILSNTRKKGSPPHTWGIPKKYDKVLTIVRITPTYMGNTVYAFTVTFPPRDHPHIHGEYMITLNVTMVIPGSPPHTWGIHFII